MSDSEDTILKHNVKTIVHLIEEQRGFDFHGYRTSMLGRRIQKRILSTKCKNTDEYIEYLSLHNDEVDQLIDVFTINVSHFFRNSFSFEFLRKIIIPRLLIEKVKRNETNLRIWSAGCSSGEEPYTLALIIKELIEKEEASINLNIFATDIDENVLKSAIQGSYNYNSITKVQYGILDQYFTKKGNQFHIAPAIKEMVQFSFYDLLDKKHKVPPESIYGGFDIVLCRNVLIYFDLKYQKLIFEKLYQSLKRNGYLILGEAESPLEDFKNKFKRETKNCKIYRKIG